MINADVLKPFFPEDYVIYDVETSGLNPKEDRILEIGVLLVCKGVSTTAMNWLLNPIYPHPCFIVPPEITKITGLSESEISFGKDPKKSIERFLEIIDEAHTIIVHNGIEFDHQFLVSECNRYNLTPPSIERYVDTAAIFKAWKLGRIDEIRQPFYEFAEDILSTKAYGLKFNLVHCCNDLNVGIADITAHRAMGDVKMTYRLVEAIRELFIKED